MNIRDFMVAVANRYERVRCAEEAGPWSFQVSAHTPEDAREIGYRITKDREDVPKLLAILEQTLTETARQMHYGIRQHEAAQDALRERDVALQERNEAWEELAVLRGTIEGETWAGAVLAQKLKAAQDELKFIRETYGASDVAELTRDALVLKLASLENEKQALLTELARTKGMVRQAMSDRQGQDAQIVHRLKDLAGQLGLSDLPADSLEVYATVLKCLREREDKLKGERDVARQEADRLRKAAQNVHDALQGVIGRKSDPVCPACGADAYAVDRSMLLTSDPPQYKAACGACGHTGYVYASGTVRS